MRILFYASHLLHHRSLIPVMIELSRRGHEIVVQTTRPDWLGMPTWQMNWRPTKVTGINRTSLAWLAGIMGYGQDWQIVQDRVRYERWFVPEEQDAAVATTKDMHFLRDMGLEINGYMTTYAVGYQHFPAIINVGDCAWTDRLLGRDPPPPMPEVFTRAHAFGAAHGFDGLSLRGRITPCGFPHLDKVPKASKLRREDIIAIQHHGGYRGLAGHRWLDRLIRTAESSGYRADVILHPIPGFGYGRHAICGAITGQTVIWDTQWEIADRAKYVLTTGSSSAYDYWSVGLKNVYILTYLGGGRDKAFRMFPDICIDSEDEFKLLLSGRLGRGNYPITKEVMNAFDAVHTGHGARAAADVIEGKR